jgi:hypothetical protein
MQIWSELSLSILHERCAFFSGRPAQFLRVQVRSDHFVSKPFDGFEVLVTGKGCGTEFDQLTWTSVPHAFHVFCSSDFNSISGRQSLQLEERTTGPLRRDFERMVDPTPTHLQKRFVIRSSSLKTHRY